MIIGKVGSFELKWESVPQGPCGTAHLAGPSGPIEVRWQRDESGIWIELPHGVFGFDIQAETDDDGRVAYRLRERGGPRQWAGVSYQRAGEAHAAGAAGQKAKPMRVRAQMPGKIVRVLVKPGQKVEKDQPLLVMEAMKMENEIRAQGSAAVKEVKVIEGQAVESGADLVTLESGT